MNKKEQRAAALKAAQEIVAKAKGESRELTDEEFTQVTGYTETVKSLDVEIKAVESRGSVLAELGSLSEAAKGAGVQRTDEYQQAVKTIGEHFVKEAGDRLKAARGQSGAVVAAKSEWMGPTKAAGDTQTVGAVYQTPVLTEFDRTVVRQPRQRLVIADLLGAGTLGGNAISYFVENPTVEGGFGTVAESGQKPQLHFLDPTTVTDNLKKIAGFIKFSDEMLEDLDFVVSEINTRLLYELGRFEELQLLRGNGTGTNVLGLLNRNGIQKMTRTASDSVADFLFKGMTAVSTGSDLDADGIVIHPLDYQDLRLSKDGNDQYFGGGYFQGQYGNGGVLENPPIWGLRTVVTPAVNRGEVIIGAFAQAATVYRKGGVRVESTNSHANDFTTNLVTVRAEERVALAVRRPAGIAHLTLTPAGGAA